MCSNGTYNNKLFIQWLNELGLSGAKRIYIYITQFSFYTVLT